MMRDLHTLRAEYRTLQAAADAARRDAQAAQENAKFVYESALWPDASVRAEEALARWFAADDAAGRAWRAVVEAEDEAMGAA